MAALFTAVDISTIATSVGTLLVAVIGIKLLFVGFRYVNRTMNKA